MLRLAAVPTSIAITALATAMLASITVWKYYFPCKRQERIRKRLPSTLSQWRDPGGTYAADQQIWAELEKVFRDGNLIPWHYAGLNILCSPHKTYPLSTGYSYALVTRTTPDRLGNVQCLRRFNYQNPLSRIARTQDGHDLVVRVIVIGKEGHGHLNILRKLATGENSLYSNNHVLPMFTEFQFQDIIFGLFPRVGGTLFEMYGCWTRNAVGDIVSILMQTLEALEFIHDLNIAHRDVFLNNFLVQWHPESLLTMRISPSHPRVYLIDFEFAVEFPQECPEAERVSIGYPLGGSLTNPDDYGRPLAPEVASGRPYNSFKLDIWQLGNSFSDFRSRILPIDEILADMADDDPTRRPDARQALDRLQTVVNSMTPESLLTAPVVIRDD